VFIAWLFALWNIPQGDYPQRIAIQKILVFCYNFFCEIGRTTENNVPLQAFYY
jgi:hypothetical protein